MSTNYPEKSEMLKKRGKKQSDLSSVLVMNGEEVFKFVNRLARDCGFFQLVPVFHSPGEESVFCTRLSYRVLL